MSEYLLKHYLNNLLLNSDNITKYFVGINLDDSLIIIKVNCNYLFDLDFNEICNTINDMYLIETFNVEIDSVFDYCLIFNLDKVKQEPIPSIMSLKEFNEYVEECYPFINFKVVYCKNNKIVSKMFCPENITELAELIKNSGIDVKQIVKIERVI